MIMMPHRCNHCAVQMTQSALKTHRCRVAYRQIRCSICFLVSFSERVMEAHVLEHGPFTPFEITSFPAKVEKAREIASRIFNLIPT